MVRQACGVNQRTSSQAAPLHLVFKAVDGLVPFDEGPGRAAVLTMLRRLARTGEVVVLAFAIRAAEVELLIAPTEPDEWPARLRTGLTRAVNRALSRRGVLLQSDAVVNVLGPDQDWVALADAIEASGAADTPATSAHADHVGWVRQNSSETPSSRESRAALAAGPEPQTIGDVIEVADVPTVVQFASLRELVAGLRSGAPDLWLEPLRAYVSRWYLGDRRTLAVVRTLLGALAQTEHGGGYFVSGLYGAGKSHLLAVLALLAEFDTARAELHAAQPPLRDLLGQWPARPLLVVAIDLDGCAPGQSLEDVVFDAAQRTLAVQCGVHAPLAEASWVVAQTREHLMTAHRAALDRAAGGDWPALAEQDAAAAAEAAQRMVAAARLPFRFVQSRVERLGRLEELAARAGCRGVLLLLDELSIFLGSRDGHGLQADAGFLQFLGQRAALGPLWVVAALQKQIEDVGPIEHYTLRQVKDRFETRLALPLTAAREVLNRKVLPRKTAAAADHAVAACVPHWTSGQRLPDLTAAALRETYPLHPLTMSALEACAERFLAKTRSVIEFAAARVAGDELAPGVLPRPVTALLCCDELWDHFARDLVQHPDLRRYHELFVRYYEQNLPALLADGQDAALALRLVKLLAILRLAGLDRGVRDLAAALLPATPSGCRQVAELLETMRSTGPYLTVERRTGPAGDIYRVDLEFDVNQTIRRRANALAASMSVGDARLTSTAVGLCRLPDFPLATALHERVVKLTWRHTPRTGFVALQDLRRLSSRALSNQAALVSGCDVNETFYLQIAEPQRTEAQAEAFELALAGVADERWRSALVAWVPREATADERQVWAEDVAHELLRGDPTLTAGGLGAALLARLDEDAEARESRLTGLLLQLYRDGVWLTAAGRQPVTGASWRAMLEQLGECVLPRLYPDFETVAPHGPLEPGVANPLIERLVIPGECTAAPHSVLARDLAQLAVPLGVAAVEAGRYTLREPGDLTSQALHLLPETDVSVAAVERCWAVSSLGLDPEQSRLLLATLIRLGHLVAIDDTGGPATLGAPLRSHLSAVRLAPLVEEATWETVARFCEAWLNQAVPSLSRAGQQSVWDRLRAWREAALSQVAAIRSASERIAEICGHEPLQWRDVLDEGTQVAEIAAAVRPELPSAAGLAAFAEVVAQRPAERLSALWSRHRKLREFAERRAGALGYAWHVLRDVALPDGELAIARERLLATFAKVDDLAFHGDQLLASFDHWRRQYAAAYAAWHAAQHDSTRFSAYDEALHGWRMRALGNLSRLALDHSSSAAAVSEAAVTERRKQCRRADLTVALREALVCPDCGLLLGESVPLRPVAELEAEAEAAVAERLGILQTPAYRDELQAGLGSLPADDPRVVAARALLAWHGPLTERLLPLTGFAVIDLLNLLLRSPVVGHRSVQALAGRMTNQRLTKRQLRAQFEQWLDPDGRLEPDDLLQIDP